MAVYHIFMPDSSRLCVHVLNSIFQASVEMCVLQKKNPMKLKLFYIFRVRIKTFVSLRMAHVWSEFSDSLLTECCFIQKVG